MIYTDQNIESQVNKKYNFYQIEILNRNLMFNGKKVVPKKFPLIDNKCGTYFHIITTKAEDNRKNLLSLPCPNIPCTQQCTFYFKYNPLINDATEKRAVCPQRLDNIEFIKDFLTQSNMKIWKKNIGTKNGRKDRILFLDDINNYIVILDERNTYYMLWTAYPIETTKRKNNLLREYSTSNSIIK